MELWQVLIVFLGIVAFAFNMAYLERCITDTHTKVKEIHKLLSTPVEQEGRK